MDPIPGDMWIDLRFYLVMGEKLRVINITTTEKLNSDGLFNLKKFF